MIVFCEGKVSIAKWTSQRTFSAASMKMVRTSMLVRNIYRSSERGRERDRGERKVRKLDTENYPDETQQTVTTRETGSRESFMMVRDFNRMNMTQGKAGLTSKKSPWATDVPPLRVVRTLSEPGRTASMMAAPVMPPRIWATVKMMARTGVMA